tara:strand:- start:15438 stop:16244 length:807 start_codon:yes stop_codon:yes gene_type:complete
MGYLNIYNNALSGNTLRLYLSDYGKSILGSDVSLLSAIEKFGLSDSDIDYRRFTNSGSCVSQISLSGNCDDTTSVSALTGSCFYDLPDSRGGDPITLSASYGTLASVMAGPTFELKNGNIKFYNTSLGVNPNQSTLWANYTPPTPADKVEEPGVAMMSSCWSKSNVVSNLFPAYCVVCADFNKDGYVDLSDYKTFLSFMGGESKTTELVGDFDGNGIVDKSDLNTFLRCLSNNGENVLGFCEDKYVFCSLCEHLGNASLCNGDCISCI